MSIRIVVHSKPSQGFVLTYDCITLQDRRSKKECVKYNYHALEQPRSGRSYKFLSVKSIISVIKLRTIAGQSMTDVIYKVSLTFDGFDSDLVLIISEVEKKILSAYISGGNNV